MLHLFFKHLMLRNIIWSLSLSHPQIGQLLGEAEYQQQILPCVVRLFSSSDRATRLRLLQQAGDLAPHIDPATLNAQVFPHLASGFLDTNPTIRENTVKV